MDGQRFDDLTRRLARATSRRAVLKGLGGSVTAALLGRVGARTTSAEEVCDDDKCPPARCTQDKQCRYPQLCGPDNLCQRGCRIAGVFYAPGNVQPGNVCHVCRPARSTTTWSNADGVACETGNHCTVDTCLGGTCRAGRDVVTPTCPLPDACHRPGRCQPTTGECAYGAKNDLAPCTTGNACLTNERCTAGVCGGGTPVDCGDDTFCATYRCDPSQGCLSDLAASGTACAATTCANDAETRSTCNETGTCQTGAPVSCAPYRCTADGTVCRTTCSDDNQCLGSAYCREGACVDDLTLGATCGRDSQCRSGTCADGVCCDGRCGGRCEACGADGVCRAVTGAPVGGRAACAGNGVCAGRCDGQTRDACTFPGSGQTCGQATCQGTTAVAAGTCNGTGGCTAGQTTDCTTLADACNDGICADGACARQPKSNSIAPAPAFAQRVCPDGICFNGSCCDAGPFGDNPFDTNISCDPNKGGVCCVAPNRCCDGTCCMDCFGEPNVPGSVTPNNISYFCCAPANLCPSGSSGTGDCCSNREVCVEYDDGTSGCVNRNRACAGQFCDGECCNETCCGNGTYCNGTECATVPNTACTEDNQCGTGLKCANVGYRIETGDGTPRLVPIPGSCCPDERFCPNSGTPEPGRTNGSCCAFGNRCDTSNDGGSVCCTNSQYYDACGGSCTCSPRGPRIRY